MERLCLGCRCPISVASHRVDAIDALTATAGDMAATPAVVTSPEDSLAQAACLMHDYDIHHLLVVDSTSRRPVGIVSTLDLAAVVASAASSRRGRRCPGTTRSRARRAWLPLALAGIALLATACPARAGWGPVVRPAASDHASDVSVAVDGSGRIGAAWVTSVGGRPVLRVAVGTGSHTDPAD